MSFADTPLSDAVKFLAEFHDARIRLDAVASGETVGLAQMPVTLVTEKQSLAHVLNRLTQSAGAVWMIHRGEILITSPAREQDLQEARVYRVGRLLRLAAKRAVLPAPPPRPVVSGFSGVGPMPAEPATDAELTRFIEESTSAPWINTSGEGGQLSAFGDQLIVRQTYRGHEEIARLLRFTELALSRAPGSPPLLVMSPEEVAQLARLQKTLRKEIDLRLPPETSPAAAASQERGSTPIP